MNLKQILMELGNRLVTERGFNPAIATADPNSTRPIAEFTKWLNSTPEARMILREMGVYWPVVETRSPDNDS